ncbi:DUF2850 domain-containing protein [Vibrio sp. V39_P1S14PM300]|uniref:DUF2850 domain-containing protein n=1 Tax=Vibrio sp. V39_P1S14PM300 TaxID=1938690 RepID=UPI0013725990|nr:DUF2850 domain-containing protein [Vibrio sp. V39_P1S14PM300]NAX21605.1 DUF2850 domain-containing protein [Vibrio sp. V39_P1S14PM300]
MLLVACGLIAVALLYNQVYAQLSERLHPKQAVYGTWVEQNVASYASDRFTLGPEGVSQAGRVLTTRYEFDGRYVMFATAQREYRFQLLNDELTEMRLISQNYYQPVYRLSGKFKKNLR